MHSNRDNFPAKIKKILADRAAHTCSNPDCRVSTIASSKSNDSAVNNIGKAAHICAASPNGPRYDCAMTSHERKAIQNAIWLCANCADKIDRDVVLYSKQKLLDWKIQADKTSILELGKKPLPLSHDVDLLSQVFTGTATKNHPNLVSNVHKAREMVLESLDPRFSVRSSYVNGQEVLKISSKQNVLIEMKIAPDLREYYVSQHLKMIENAEEVEISYKAGQISTESSALLQETILNSNGMILSPPSLEATLKISFVDSKTQIIEPFDDITGVLRYGTKQMIFKGKGCGDVLNVEIKIDRETGDGLFVFLFDFDLWENKDLRALTYVKKLVMVSQALGFRKLIQTSIECNGEEILKGRELKYE